MAKLHIKRRYGQTPDQVLNSRDLSWKAKGLFGYIQSKPEDWDFAIERMESKDGKDSTRAGIRELEHFWYLIRDKIRQPDGTIDVEYTLYEEPTFPQPVTENHGGKPATVKNPTMAENPTAENPTAENPPSIKDIPTQTEIHKQNTLALFAIFWDKYPNKKSKKSAEKAFLRLSSKDQGIAVNILNNHLTYWRKKYGTQGKEKYPTTFIPYPATWLNGEKWDDKLEEIIPEVRKSPADFAKAKRIEEDARKRIQEARKKEQEAEEVRKRARRYFNELPIVDQQRIKDRATKELSQMEWTKQKFPDQYRIIYEGKIISIIVKDEFKRMEEEENRNRRMECAAQKINIIHEE